MIDNCDCLINERKKYVGKYNSSWFGKLRRTNKVIKVGKFIQNMTSELYGINNTHMETIRGEGGMVILYLSRYGLSR